MRVCGLSVIFIAKKCVKYMLKLKVSLAILNKVIIFAMSNNERPHNLTKTQKDC